MKSITESVLLEKYKVLFNFLVCWFPEMYFDNLTEKDVVEEYKLVSSKQRIIDLIKEAEEVRNNIGVHWKDVSNATNIYLKNEQEALEWLNKVIELLKK